MDGETGLNTSVLPLVRFGSMSFFYAAACFVSGSGDHDDIRQLHGFRRGDDLKTLFFATGMDLLPSYRPMRP